MPLNVYLHSLVTVEAQANKMAKRKLLDEYIYIILIVMVSNVTLTSGELGNSELLKKLIAECSTPSPT